MNRLRIALLSLLLALAPPAEAKRLAAIAVTAPVTAQISLPVQSARVQPAAVNIQARLIYGSGGTTISAWVQTSLDGGATWADVASFGFTTAAATFVMNVSGATPKLTPIVLTDGSLASGTAIDGLVGTQWRVKYTSTGTYVGTTLVVDINGAQFTTSP